ncbi:hypothetical protein [Georgenia sp. AZ-5]|uniref:hypothetical protein n=1 Tax=Georgenia sp. AZ-5 TaxID=3367526 RepID=UPI003754D5F4
MTPAPAPAPVPETVAEAAVADLTARLGSGDAPVRVVLAQRETFPDGSLGCPRPGHLYTQALVDGYRVVLARGDREWLYTAGPDGVPHLCERDDGGTGPSEGGG